MWCKEFWECSECGGRIEQRRPPVVCAECGTAGAIFVPLDDPNDELEAAFSALPHERWGSFDSTASP